MHRLLRECCNYLLSLKGTEPFFIQLLLYRFHSLLNSPLLSSLLIFTHRLVGFFWSLICLINLFWKNKWVSLSRYLAKLHRNFSKNFPRSIQLYNWREKPRAEQVSSSQCSLNQAFSLRPSLPEEMERD